MGTTDINIKDSISKISDMNAGQIGELINKKRLNLLQQAASAFVIGEKKIEDITNSKQESKIDALELATLAKTQVEIFNYISTHTTPDIAINKRKKSAEEDQILQEDRKKREQKSKNQNKAIIKPKAA